MVEKVKKIWLDYLEMERVLSISSYLSDLCALGQCTNLSYFEREHVKKLRSTVKDFSTSGQPVIVEYVTPFGERYRISHITIEKLCTRVHRLGLGLKVIYKFILLPDFEVRGERANRLVKALMEIHYV